MEQFLSNIILTDDLNSIHAGEFNVLGVPRGWGKTTFMFDERIVMFARSKKHILYLIHTKLLRDSIAINHKDIAKVFMDSNGNGWFAHRKGLWTDQKDEDYIHVMCYQTFAALLRNEGIEWLNDIDLIVWDEFDDVRGYYENEVKKLTKILPNFSRERIIALLQEGNGNSVINFVYLIKENVLKPGRIKLIAISATPENAAYYFHGYINYIFTKKLEEKYAAATTIYIDGVVSAIKDGIIAPGRRYWCFTKYVTDAFVISEAAEAAGLRPVVVWSESNSRWRDQMTTERRVVLRCLREEQRVPEKYDMLIITAAGGRGIDIYDTSIQDWICDSDAYEDINQFIRARFVPARQYLLNSSKGVVDFTQKGFAPDYYEWHTLEELRKLVEEKPVFTKGPADRTRLTTFNAIKREYGPAVERRQYGKTKIVQYRINSQLLS